MQRLFATVSSTTANILATLILCIAWMQMENAFNPQQQSVRYSFLLYFSNIYYKKSLQIIETDNKVIFKNELIEKNVERQV